MRGTVISYLRRTPTRTEITAADVPPTTWLPATILRVRPPDFDGPGSPHLILARPGTATQIRLVNEIAHATLVDRTRMRFEPTVMAQDLATSVEVLVAAIQAKPTDHLDQSSAERLATSVDAPLEAFEAFDVISRRAQSDQQLHIRTVIEHICPQRLDVGYPAEGYDEIDRAVTVHL